MDRSQLGVGIYTIPQAALLVGISAARLRGWVTGYHNMKATPLIESEFAPLDHHIAISFVNLIEARFIDAFAQSGINVRSMRAMAAEARRFLNHPHPFATEMMFQTDGRKIFMRAVEEAGDPMLYDLKGKNFGMYEVLSRELRQGVLYGSAGIATAWYPRKGLRRVFVNPKVAFGQPSLDVSGVPTAAIVDAVAAEGGNHRGAARWFNIPVSHVKEAVQFEQGFSTLH